MTNKYRIDFVSYFHKTEYKYIKKNKNQWVKN